MQADSPEPALAALLAGQLLVDIERFRGIWNMRDDETLELADADGRLFSAEGGLWAASHRLWDRADERLMLHLDSWHREHPEQAGIKVTDLKSALVQRGESPLVMATLSARLQGGDLALREGRVSRAGFKPAVSVEDTDHWQRLQQLLTRSGRRIPLLSELSAQTGIAPPKLELLVKKAVKNGDLHGVTDKRYALPAQLHELAGALLSLADNGEPITVVGVKSHFGTGRNLTIEILEYFDRIRFTRRQGDSRLVLDRELPDRLFRR
jgi:selenocysteine-specific elongation factor